MIKYEILEKFINNEKIENLTPIVELVKEKTQHDIEFHNYLFTKYPPAIVFTDTIGCREFLLARWMEKLYPCWTTGHSNKTAPCFSISPIPFAIIHNNTVYASEGKNQYWHHDDFNGCNTIDEFKERIVKLKKENERFLTDVLSFNSEYEIQAEHAITPKTDETSKTETQLAFL